MITGAITCAATSSDLSCNAARLPIPMYISRVRTARRDGDPLVLRPARELEDQALLLIPRLTEAHWRRRQGKTHPALSG